MNSRVFARITITFNKLRNPLRNEITLRWPSKFYMVHILYGTYRTGHFLYGGENWEKIFPKN